MIRLLVGSIAAIALISAFFQTRVNDYCQASFLEKLEYADFAIHSEIEDQAYADRVFENYRDTAKEERARCSRSFR